MVQANTDDAERAVRSPKQSPGEVCARALAWGARLERKRAEKALDDVFEILVNPDDEEPLTSREWNILDRYFDFLRRTDGAA